MPRRFLPALAIAGAVVALTACQRPGVGLSPPVPPPAAQAPESQAAPPAALPAVVPTLTPQAPSAHAHHAPPVYPVSTGVTTADQSSSDSCGGYQ